MGGDEVRTAPPNYNLAGWAFAVVGGTLPVLALFNHRAIVPVCAVLALILLFQWGPSKALGQLRSLSILTKCFGIGFFIWAAASTLWAPDMSQSLTTLGKLSGTTFIGLVLIGSASFMFDGHANRVLWIAFISTVSVSCLLLIDIYSGGVFSLNVFGKGIHAPYGAFWFKPVATILAIAFWPIAAFMWRIGRRALAIFSFVLAIAVMDAISVNTGLLATSAGLVIAFIFLAMGRLRVWIAIGVLATAIFATPVIVGSILKPQEITPSLSSVSSAQNSIAYRLHVWHFAANAFFEKPVTGWGLNSSRHIGQGEIVSDSVRGEIGEAIPLHPHNSVLQVYLELGVIGALLILGLLLCLLRRLGDDDWKRSDRIFAFGMFTAVLLFYVVSFSTWSSWWNAYLCYAVALFEVARRSSLERG